MDDVFKADAAEGFRHEFDAAAVKGRIDNLEVCMLFDGLRAQGEGGDVAEVALVHLCTHHLNGSLAFSFDGLEADSLRAFDLIDFGYDILVNRSGNLAAVFPEDFVAVIFLGVVAGCDHDASRGFLGADAVAELRRGTKAFEQIYLDAVVGKDIGRNLGKELRVVAGVIADAHALFTGNVLFDVVGKALRGHAHRVFVHAVGTCTHSAAKAAGSKLESTVEGVLKGGFVRVHQVFDFGFGLGIKMAVQPALSHLHVIFHSAFFYVYKCRDYSVLLQHGIF